MRPSEVLQQHLEEVRATIARFPVANPRLFGSVARGEDVEGSDLDILVDAPTATLFELAGLEIELEDLLGIKVDIATSDELRRSIGARVQHDARPI